MPASFDTIDELFNFAAGESKATELEGMVKPGNEGEVLFAAHGCEEWISLPKNIIKRVEYLFEKPCVKPGEAPHSHPYVRISVSTEHEQGPYLRMIATLLRQSRQRNVSLQARSSSRGRRGAALDDDCQYGYGACGQYNPDTGEYCPSDTRPCYEDGYTWCKPFPECAELRAPSVRTMGIPVGGNAGNCTDVWYDGHCYWAKNRCSRKVNVQLGPWSALLNPGETFKFTGFGDCFQSYVGPTLSNYA